MIPIIIAVFWITFIVWFVGSLSGAPYMDDNGNEIDKNVVKDLSRMDTLYH